MTNARARSLQSAGKETNELLGSLLHALSCRVPSPLADVQGGEAGEETGAGAEGGGGGRVVPMLDALTDLILYEVCWPRMSMGSWVKTVQGAVTFLGSEEQRVRRSAAALLARHQS
jgi:hypothetical protein